MASKAHSEYFLGGGRGSGKSSFASIELVLSLLRDPDAGAAVVRKYSSSLRSSVYEQTIWALDRLGIGHLFDKRVSLMEMTYLPTGQQILFRGADDPSKLKSLKPAKGHFAFLWFEEASEFGGMDIIRSIRASVIRGGYCATVYTFNPPRSSGAWINAEASKPGPGRVYHVSDYRSMPEDWLGNEFIRSAEELMKEDLRRYEHMYLGRATGSDAQVFNNLTVRKISDKEAASFDRLYAGLDFGYANDPDALVVAHFDKKCGELFIIGEFVRPHNDTFTLVSEVMERAGSLEIICDSSEPRLINELRSRGARARPAKKGPGSVERGIRFLQELRSIVIDPSRAPVACREFTSYEYPVSGEYGVIPSPPDRDNHTIDALRYALEPVMTNSRASTLKRPDLIV